MSPIGANRRDGSAVFPLFPMPIKVDRIAFGTGTDRSLTYDAQVVAYRESLAAGSKIELKEITYLERKVSKSSYSAVGFIGHARGDLVLCFIGGRLPCDWRNRYHSHWRYG